MAFMTVNRVRIRKIWILPLFAWVIWRIRLQAKNTPGNLGVRIFRTRGLAVWTVTAWTDEQAMLAFRDSGPHGSVRPKKPIWFDQAAITDWLQTDPLLPSNEEAATILKNTGRLSALRFPSAEQARGEIVVS